MLRKKFPYAVCIKGVGSNFILSVLQVLGPLKVQWSKMMSLNVGVAKVR